MRAIAILGLVRRLLTLEAAESQDQDLLIGAAERVLDKLHVHLSKRIGQEGYRTLLARALALTTARFPHLNAARVGPDGALVGLHAAATGTAAAETGQGAARDAVDGAMAVVADLIALLITFIGEDLTLRLLRTLWPTLRVEDVPGDTAVGENEEP